jgi:glucose-6-phosphate isomerase
MLGKDLKFGAVTREPDVRVLDEMRGLLLDTEYANGASNRPLYYMYRNLYRTEHHESVMHDHDLRFDITVMAHQPLGREYVKTKGHYHPEAAHGVAYPEIYEVMDGTAHYLLQKTDSSGGVADVIVVKASAGDKVIIPPGYGHITINPSDQPLKMANWVSTQFESQYGDMVEKQGGAYYETIAGDWVRNQQYASVPDIRFTEPVDIDELDIVSGDDSMYRLIESPNKLAFLNRPHKYQWVFEDLY